MASSSSSHPQRRKHADGSRQARRPLGRTNSSLLGTIRNIVTAPLSWFSSTDDFEDSKDPGGKRRRLQDAPLDSPEDHTDRGARTKRMRVHSPSPDRAHRQQPYLDPPANAFRPSAPPLSHQPTLQELSSNLPANAVRSTLSPMRHLSISRTMSVDPPARPASRGLSVQQSLQDVSMEHLPLPLPLPAAPRPPSALRRDNSMPPLSLAGRPSFRMRTSMTPQPQPVHRERSEPPTLSSLTANPVFVRGPTEHFSDLHRDSSARPVVTLGLLAESVRSTKSPVRQHSHSSLLLGSSAADQPAPSHLSPAEKALHELDVYKTPLLPTRLRSANSVTSSLPPSASLPDMFKSRRASHLVLMQDDRDSSGRLGRRVSGEKAVVNETKPYAGQGGMKKLLARRKQEAEDEVQESNEQLKDQNADVLMDDSNQKKDKDHVAAVSLPSNSQPVPPPPKSDWYSEVSQSKSSSGSSLRVGRAKTSRNHFARPATRPLKNTFSAVFEDEGDDTMEDEAHLERERERKELEEAANKAPLFEIPAGFSFAKEVKPIEHDLTNAKEPPLMSLPFSLSTTPSSTSTAGPSPSFLTDTKMEEDKSKIAQNASSSEFVNGGSSSNTPFSAPPVVEKASNIFDSAVFSKGAKETSSSANHVPNFFAKSSVLSKPLDVKPPPPLNFGLPPPEVGTKSAFFFAPPSVPNAENSVLDSKEEKIDEASNALPSASNDSDKQTTNAGSTPVSSLLFGSNPLAASPFAFKPSGNDTVKADTVKSVSASLPVPELDMAQNVTASKPAASTFVSTSSLFGNDIKQVAKANDAEAPVQNADGSKDATAIGPITSASPPAPFSFGVPANSESVSSSVPTPLFGKPSAKTESSGSVYNGGFTFGTPAEQKEKEKLQSSPFSFGPTQTTSDAKASPFTFGASSPATPAPSTLPATFLFDGSSSSAGDTSSAKPFTFGLPSSTAAVERPVTPPRNQDQEFRMEESPTREIQHSTDSSKRVESRPSLNFSFGTSAPPSGMFGSQSTPTETTSPFSFGTSTTSTNPFATVTKDSKPEEPKTFGGFGVSATTPITPSTGFTFGSGGDVSRASEPPRPSTTGSFPFSSTPTSASGSAPFSFATPSTLATNPFGQTQSGSAPSSPSTFSQPSPFAFGQPAPQQPAAAPFAFGSQPASPAGLTTISLPPPGTPVGFGSSTSNGFGAPDPSSPFSAPTPLAPAPSSGGALFTIGAAPAPNPASRQIKKLPSRRGAKR